MKLYRVIVFGSSESIVRKYRKVANPKKLGDWLFKNGFSWRYMNLYDQKEKHFFGRYYPNGQW